MGLSDLDIPLFAAALLNDSPNGCADVNVDGSEDGRDVAAFTAALLAGACP
jgi:hypothetical protein